MRFFQLLFIARRHLVHDLFRTTISVGGVSMGVAFMIMLGAIMTGFEKKFVDETIEASPHITVYDEFRGTTDEFAVLASVSVQGVVEVRSARPRERVYRIKKPLELLEVARRTEGVQAAAMNAVGTAILNFGNREVGCSLVGIDPDAQERVVATDKYVLGGRLHDLHSAGGAVILGAGLAEKLGIVRGDTVTASLKSGGARALRVVGLLKTGIVSIDNVRAYTLVGLAQQLLGNGRDVNRIVLRLDDHERARDVASDLERVVGYKTESWQEANANFLAIFVIQQTITWIVTGGIMIVAAFGILNVLIMLVMEKYPEIAMLKSMGYTAVDVTTIFLLEGLAIGVMGVVVGSTLGFWGAELLGTLPIPQKGLVDSEHLIINNAPRLYVIAAISALASTVLASVMPALRAGRLDPVDTLRGHA